MNKLLSKIIILVVLICIGLVVVNKFDFFNFGSIFSFFENKTEIEHGPIILEAIKKSAKLETINMVLRTDTRVRKLDGLCDEQVQYLGIATVSAGIDLDLIKDTDISVEVDEKTKTPLVKIALPPAQILHAELDIPNGQVIKHRVLAFPFLCRYGTQMDQAIREAQAQAKSYAKNTAQVQGIIQLAQEHAQEVLKSLLKPLNYTNVEISFGAYTPVVY